MKKVLYSLLGIIPLLIGGYFLFQTLNGNSDAMVTYLEETYEFGTSYNTLIGEEVTIAETGTDEELTTFTQDRLIPELEKIASESKAYGDGIKKEELKALHDLDVQSLEKYIAAQYAWLEGNQEEADALFTESEQLTAQFEEDIDDLAKTWAVEIEWEE
ncbi:hypothetical protein NC661_05350 [Aquibacillus koreensis]|uniref:Uncharacterized protein n=1 Tax=Aquibacillus koreensis TaxID=279446 RepID=A0A9X3WHE3_9BACI|nr:hypothetical protein [Aquibacillus koreensis]MCT2535275.1 hypothetical protein [Aquibacillus koreensis]MDC3419792.1 hypothetical protein [Aquibacillus koreensis]